MAMNKQPNKVGRAITRFVENPVTILVKGVVLLLIGLSEAARTLRYDLTHGQVRIGHGLIIIGLFGILEALPHLLDGLGAWVEFSSLRDEEDSKRKGGP